MTQTNKTFSTEHALRLRAEEVAASASGYADDLSPIAMRKLIHELRVHQIELEMQNDELRRTQAALDTAQARYFDFYDLAPVGYATVSGKALILQANFTAVNLLGVPRARLIGKALPGFIVPADADSYHLLCQQALASGMAQSTELRVRRSTDGQSVWIHLQAIAATGDDGAAVIRMVLSDITERKQMEQAAVDASEHKFRLVADTTSDGIVIFGAKRQIEYVSPTYVKQLGYTEAELLGCAPDLIYARVHPEDRDVLLSKIERAIGAQEADLLYWYRIQHRLGHYIWREDHTRFQYDAAGHLSGVCVVARDITERRLAEIEMRIAAAAFESQEAMMITDANSVILRVNRAFTQITGYMADEAIGQTPQLLQSGRHDADFYRQLWDTVRSTGKWQGEVWDRHKDGSVYPKWLTITAVSGIDGAVSHYIGSHFDLSERKRAEAAMLEMNRDLTKSRQQLRRLVALNESRLEKEKRHIAREVHDELGQVLTALRMGLSVALIRHASQMPDLQDALKVMKTQVDRAIQGVRHVATRLRPAALDMGLIPAIEWLCDEFTRHSGVVCELQAPTEPLVFDANRAVVVFRIVQESLTNISKYAQASQVAVNLAQHGNELRLAVRDNGVGFDLAAVALRGSLGLLGMRERVIALGGQIEVISAPGQGTGIAVVIPLETAVAGDPA